MFRAIQPAVVILGVCTVSLGLLWPVAFVGLAGVAFPAASEGSLVRVDGAVRGSALVGQGFDDPGWFWPRPSATGPFPYNAASSSGSNLGPSNSALHEAVQQRIEALKTADIGAVGPWPADLVTASGSGLDPDLSPEAARFQVRRVAKARGLDEAAVAALVEAHVQGRVMGVLGQPHVNVLALNLALDRLASPGERSP
jgi:K+-transporting ATPase ATPase C chain